MLGANSQRILWWIRYFLFYDVASTSFIGTNLATVVSIKVVASNANIASSRFFDCSSFKYHISYLNHILDYTPPDHKAISILGTHTAVANRITCKTHEIKLSVSIDNSGARGFNYTLKVANIFEDIVLNNNLYNVAVQQLCDTHQNHVLCNATYQASWNQAMTNTKDIKSGDGMYKDSAFQKICIAIFNFVASAGCPVAVGNVLLHYLCSGNKKPLTMSPQTFLTFFQKVLQVVKLVDCYYEKELDDKEAKILFFYSIPKEHIQVYVYKF